MEEFKFEKDRNTEISPLVRARLDETYAHLSQQAQRTVKKKPTGYRRLALASTAAGVLAVGVFISAFASPAIASSLKNIPVIGSIFASIQSDMGLRIAGELGLTSTVNRTVAYEDVNLKVTETLYDGQRAAFLLNVTAPNLDNGTYNNGKKDMRLSQAVSNIEFEIDGKTQNGDIFYGSVGEAHPNTLLFEVVMDPQTAPYSFDSSITITLDGIDHEFAVNIPFEKTTNQTAELSPGTVTSSDNLTFSVDKAWVTPITTRLTTSIALTDAVTLTDNEEKRLLNIRVAIFDDQGRRLTPLNGEGVIEGNRLVFDYRYASQLGTSKYYIAKPFIIKDSFEEDIEEKQYLKGLETIIELPFAN